MPQVNIRVESVSEAEQQTGVPTQKKEETKGGAKTALTSVFVHQAMNTTKQIVNYGISNIGNFTGDYLKQDRIQNEISMATDLIAVGTAFSVNIFAGLFATVGFGLKSFFEISNQQQSIRHRENNANYLRMRSGASTTNGSRTGE